MKKKLTALACAAVLTTGLFSTAAPAHAASSFTDVSPDDWFYEAVTEMADTGIIGGYPDGSFRPDQPVTNIELMKLLTTALPMDDSLGAPPENWHGELEEMMPGFWGNDVLAQTVHRNYFWHLELNTDSMNRPVTRAEMANMMALMYISSQGLPSPNAVDAALYLIGDLEPEVVESGARDAVLWLYSNGIVTGMNQNGDFLPYATTTRAQACMLLYRLLRPELRATYDWEQVIRDYESGVLHPEENQPAAPDPAGDVDFTGMPRIRHANDVAYDYCRQLERKIGIQIFYLPEWTEKDSGLLEYYNVADLPDKYPQYFQAVLEELHTMEDAYSRYPEGFLKEVAAKKGDHKIEIILCPASLPGSEYQGAYIYDSSDDPQKVDQIYYTGQGPAQYYSHEMGHWVVSSAAILNGFTPTCQTWESFNSGASDQDYISDYAMTSRPEDWAETWAFLWHKPDAFRQKIYDGSDILSQKVRYMTQLLDQAYDSFQASQLPWSDLL